MDDLRVGQGWDRHALQRGESFVLGGVEIDHDRGPVGHSDGDVLVHAVIDALFGAVNLGDIGQHFPSSSDRWKDADSMEMLTRAVNEVEGLGWSVVNVDATVLVEDIRLAGHRDRMEANISKHFSNDAPVNVKFKTADGFGPVGNRDVVDSQVVVLVKQTE